MIRSNRCLYEHDLVTKIDHYNKGYLNDAGYEILILCGKVAENMNIIKESVECSHERQTIALFSKNIKEKFPDNLPFTRLANKISYYVNGYFFSFPDPVKHIFSHVTRRKGNFSGLKNIWRVSKPFNSIAVKVRNEWIQDCLIPLNLYGLRTPTDCIKFIKTNHLTKVNICNFWDENIKELAKSSPNLSVIDLTGNFLGDVGLIKLAKNCPKLTVINLEDSLITDNGLLAIAKNCPKLMKIDLGETKVTDEGVLALAEACTKLIEISLSECNVSTDTAIQLIKNNPFLIKIDLSHTNVDGNEIIELIKNSENLKELYLSCTNLTIDNLKKLAKGSPNLEKIHAGDLEVTYQDLVDLAKACPKLKEYGFDLDGITDAEFEKFENIFLNCKLQGL